MHSNCMCDVISFHWTQYVSYYFTVKENQTERERGRRLQQGDIPTAPPSQPQSDNQIWMRITTYCRIIVSVFFYFNVLYIFIFNVKPSISSKEVVCIDFVHFYCVYPCCFDKPRLWMMIWHFYYFLCEGRVKSTIPLFLNGRHFLKFTEWREKPSLRERRHPFDKWQWRRRTLLSSTHHAIGQAWVWIHIFWVTSKPYGLIVFLWWISNDCLS